MLFRFTSMFGIVNIGLCIILFTLVTKLLMIPLTIKQQKSSKLMAVMQPELTAIQKKYKGKEGDQKAMMMMQTETKAVYEKYGTSMTDGCLPMLIQLPIIFALYRVIYNIPAYVHSVRGYYEMVIANLPAGFQSNQTFMELASSSKMLSGADFTDLNKVIDLLYTFTGKQWDVLVNAFPQVGQAVTESGDSVVSAIERMQTFFGLNIAYTPMQVIGNFFSHVDGTTVFALIAALAIPLLAGRQPVVQLQADDGDHPESAGRREPRRQHDEVHERDDAVDVRIFLLYLCNRYRTLLGGTECVHHYPAGWNQLLLKEG